MDKQKEMEYLRGLYLDKLPDENPFIMYVSEDKELFIISNGNDTTMLKLDNLSKYRGLYDTILDLRNKIIFSLDNAIKYAFTDDVQERYNILSQSGHDEWMTYYNIENAMFRIEILWDILVHFYNIKYELGEEIHKVYHSRIFSNEENKLRKYWDNNPSTEVNKIINYLNENDDTDIDGEWKGNYKFVNSLRNNMTHKFSISQSSISSYAFEFKHHPSFILKRLCESFSSLEGFVYEICNSIIVDIENEELGGEV